MKFKTNDSYLNEMQTKYRMSYGTVGEHKKANTIINVVLATSIVMPYMLGHIALIDMGIIAGVTFLAYDMLGISMDKIAFSSHSFFQTKELIKKKDAFNNASYNEQQEIIKKLKEEINEKNNTIKNAEWELDNRRVPSFSEKEIVEMKVEYEKSLSELEQCLKDAKEAEKAIEKEEEKIIDIFDSKNLELLSKAENCLGKLKEKEEICPQELLENYIEMEKYAQEIIEDARRNPVAMDKLNKTFNIYFRELISLLESYHLINDNEEEQQKRCIIINDIISEFKDHLIRLKEQIFQDGKFKFEISSSLLRESLRKENESNV